MGNLTLITEAENKLIREVLGQYILPDANFKIFRNTIGFVNKTYVIEFSERRLVLRESNPNTHPEHLGLEVEVLLFLEKVGYELAPKLISNRVGKHLTYHGAFFLLETFVPGEIKGSWNDTKNITPIRLANFFRASAGFTKIVKDFKPSREYPNFPISYYLTNGEELFESILNQVTPSAGRELLLAKKAEIFKILARLRTEMQTIGYDQFPKQLVHFDHHPGNVHYDGDEVVGLFDFDWVRFDSRYADLATTVTQSCYNYGEKKSGVFLREKVLPGLVAYRQVYGPSEFDEKIENQMLCSIFPSYVFFQVLWAMEWYRDNGKGEEGVDVLQHVINTFLLNDWQKILG